MNLCCFQEFSNFSTCPFFFHCFSLTMAWLVKSRGRSLLRAAGAVSSDHGIKANHSATVRGGEDHRCGGCVLLPWHPARSLNSLRRCLRSKCLVNKLCSFNAFIWEQCKVREGYIPLSRSSMLFGGDSSSSTIRYTEIILSYTILQVQLSHL